MIPKILHKIWLGDNPVDWKYGIGPVSDYRIEFWGDERVRSTHIYSCSTTAKVYDYAIRCIDEKKYCLASNALRLLVVYMYGGVYIDCDVEVLRPFNLVEHGFFIGYQRGDVLLDCINNAVYGACENHCLVFDMIRSLSLRPTEDSPIWASCSMTTDKLYKLGARGFNIDQIIPYGFNGIRLYSNEYFHPLSWNGRCGNVTSRTYTVHHWAKSWADQK